MFTKERLSKFLFFDLETSGKHANFGEFKRLDPEGAHIWEKKCNRMNYPKPGEVDPDAEYLEKVALFPEFGRIVCLSYGVWEPDDKMVVASIYDPSEEEMMKKIYALFLKATGRGMIPTGWNIKNFDVAWVYRKLLAYGYTIPECLQTYNRKPWEVNIFDMKEWFKVFSNLDVTFEEATYSLGIPTPKDDIDGSQVHRTFWSGEHQRVVTYCEKDVKTMILMAQKVYEIYYKS